MLSFDNSQFGVLVSDFLVDVGGVAGSMKHQGPLQQNSFLGLFRVEDHKELPSSTGILSPDVGGHEGPFGESIGLVIILGTFAQDH